MFALFISLSVASAAEPGTANLYVPLVDVVFDETMSERAPWADEAPPAPPTAWSAIGDYLVGDVYVFSDVDGEVALTCGIRSFEVRPANPDSAWAQDGHEIWAALDCPIEILARSPLSVFEFVNL